MDKNFTDALNETEEGNFFQSILGEYRTLLLLKLLYEFNYFY